MGGDGGQVIDRATMVKTKGYGFTKANGDRYANSLGEMANYTQMIFEDRGLGYLERRRVRMTQCWLSQQELQEPVVACRLGNLYNKETLIGALLNRSIPSEIGHVRALKDVKQCVITWAPAESEGGCRRMVCPVAREDLDAGSARAVVIWPSGAVISAKTLKELKLRECPVTGKPFDVDQDVVPLVPDDVELQKLRERLPAKKRKVAAAKEVETDRSGTAQVPADAATAGDAEKAKSETSAASVTSTAAESSKKAKPAEEKGKTAIYKSLFKSDGLEGFNGTRDGFGTPKFLRGANIS
mmetsp:Transcript_45164/g.125279  ORF Transcript_45164/g.125279 Transcript_45164/m.125279 type:complete len:298 (-) Transcript_45164:141-1034(-)